MPKRILALAVVFIELVARALSLPVPLLSAVGSTIALALLAGLAIILWQRPSIAQTAYLLGYEDANSFFRVFQQWEGSSPGRWREERRPARSATM